MGAMGDFRLWLILDHAYCTIFYAYSVDQILCSVVYCTVYYSSRVGRSFDFPGLFSAEST